MLTHPVCGEQPPSSLPHNSSSLPPHLKAGLLSAQRPPEPRRIAIAFDSSSAGRHTMAWANKTLFVADDEIFLLRTHPRVSTTLVLIDRAASASMLSEVWFEFRLSSSWACCLVFMAIGRLSSNALS